MKSDNKIDINKKINVKVTEIIKKIRTQPYKYGITIVIIILSIIILLIPAFIWLSYVIGNSGFGIPTNFYAGDILNYYGVMVYSVASIFLGSVALWQNKNLRMQHEKSEMNSQKPIVQITSVNYIQSPTINNEIFKSSWVKVSYLTNEDLISREKLHERTYRINDVSLIELEITNTSSQYTIAELEKFFISHIGKANIPKKQLSVSNNNAVIKLNPFESKIIFIIIDTEDYSIYENNLPVFKFFFKLINSRGNTYKCENSFTVVLSESHQTMKIYDIRINKIELVNKIS